MSNKSPKFFGSKLLRRALEMPAGLSHWPDREHGAEFSVKDSQVVQWVREQDDLQNYLVRVLMTRNIIVFDSETKTWSPNMEPEAEFGKGDGPGRQKNYDLLGKVLLVLQDAQPMPTEEWRKSCSGLATAPATFYRYIKALCQEELIRRDDGSFWVLTPKGEKQAEIYKNPPKTE